MLTSPPAASGQSAMEAWAQRRGLALLTDFYELTMLSGYLRNGLTHQPAVFEYFFRSLPAHNGFALSAGLEQLIDFLEHFRFTESDLAYLDALQLFDAATLDYLAGLRLEVDVDAVPEGTPVFPHEPLLRVTGPLPQAQLLETFILNALNYPSLIATKTARICLAAQGEPVLEFGLRRAQGPDGGLTGSRAAYVGGAVATSNVLAGKLFGIPVRGTHAHSWVMSFPDERQAFAAFADLYPKNCVLLVDTYDTLRSGVPNAIETFRQRPHLTPAIRIDSGDLAKLSKAAHRMFANAGMPHVAIVGTNDLNEDLIADLKRQGAKINQWAVGTHLITSKDHPALDGVYKLVALKKEDSWSPRIKLSGNPEKTTDPGVKRVVRCFNDENQPIGDLLVAADETVAPNKGKVQAMHRQFLVPDRHLNDVSRTEELLQPVLRGGRRISALPNLEEIRSHGRKSLAAFPEEYLRLRNPEIYWVGLSPRLGRIKQESMKRALE